jgi:transposase
MNDTLVAVDLAKTEFEIAVSHEAGKVSRRLRPKREKVLEFFAQLPAATVVMEACGTAQFFGSEIQKLGHRVVLLPAQHARPYVFRNKTDRTDTVGLLEAYRNEAIRPVPLKSPPQLLLSSLLRLRESWLGERTARINTLRGLLRERGFFIPLGARKVVPQVFALLEDADANIPDVLRPFVAELCQEIRELERRIKLCERQLAALAKGIPAVERLMTVPGIGLLIATALVAFIGDVWRFPSSRHFASYIGLVPREHSSGAKRRLGSITKRGDVYLRTLLVHGARSVLRAAKTKANPDRLQAWALRLEAKLGYNKTATALANKLARIVWAVWRSGAGYLSSPAQAA